jgi:alkylation response protein AidB-like acyl-CoA dehydrogenase
MHLEFTPETRAIRREIRRYVDEEFRPILETLDEKLDSYHDLKPSHPELTDNIRPHPIDIPDEIRDSLREKAREAGFWAMGVPEAHGGGGLDLVERSVVVEELSKHVMGLYNPGLGVLDLVPGLGGAERSTIFFERATEEQLERFYRPCLRGEATGAFALTEPAAGSDPRRMETRAEKDGDEWVIDGQKHFISWAGDADFVTVFARTTPPDRIEEPGITAFLIPTETDGFTIPREMQVIRPEQPYEIRLDDLRVPEEFVLGDAGEGLAIAKQTLSESRILYAANSLGPIDQSIRMGIDWSNDRIVGDEPLANRQAIQWKIAKSAIEYQSAKYAVYHAAWNYDQGRDVRHESSIAKYTATETLWTVLDRMVQIHGALGVSAELPLERWLREARVRRIGQGPSEVHLKTIARNLLEGYDDPDPIPMDR